VPDSWVALIAEVNMAKKTARRVSKAVPLTVRQKGKAGNAELKLTEKQVAQFLQCVATTGRLRLNIDVVGKTRIPPDLRAIVVAED
jgi:hypothetical protein